MKTSPDISIIIPCHNNSFSLNWILRSIAASTFNNLEVICIDDQSSDNSIKTLATQYGAYYHRLPEDKPGRRSMARNLGHKFSKADISFYLDGDVIPEPRLFLNCINLHKNDIKIAVKYPVYSITANEQLKEIDKLIKLIIDHKLNIFGPHITKHFGIDTRPLPKRLRGIRTKIWVLCASHCTSFFRHDIENVGGWDEAFNGWGEEDLELAYRLFIKGIDFIYPHRKNGAAYHLDHDVNWETNYKSLQVNVMRFREKHPESWTGRRGILDMFLKENQLPILS